jgi:hypothetical protein
MEGYDVISVADDKKIGTVVREEGDYVVFEHGTLRKQHHAIPNTTIEVVDSENEVRTTLSKDLIESSPKIDDDAGIDVDELGRHYGTADTSEAAVSERLEIREGHPGDRAGGIPQESPAMLGERYSSADDTSEEERLS